MRKLSLIAGTLVFITSLGMMIPNPHGKELSIGCAECHVTESWKVNPDSITFSHDVTAMPLTGMHRQTSCRSCHESLVFDEADPACIACHTDIHGQTTDNQCERCHTPESWLISNVTLLHQQTRFPLLGAHAGASCDDCHKSASLLTFEPLSVECYACHQEDYMATTQPNHIAAGYSTNCDECHFVGGYSWLEFSAHDAEYFPIYSGEHNGVWNNCNDCHTNPANYGEFSCTGCHEHNRGDMDDEHGGVSGYSYNSIACYGCHPTGSGNGSFNHNNTGFPLTGAHTSTLCQDCHTDGNTALSTACSACHQEDYNGSTNPDHGSVSLPNTCETCHTTAPGWSPARFPMHNEVYALNGAHALIADNCASCHQNSYNNTPNTCIGCHLNEYNQTNDPPHAASQFSTECLTCHTETAWKPATFEHDGQYFPIYSGKHNGEWQQCSDCHTNASDYGQFSCIDCHEHNKADTDDEHSGVNGYDYSSPSCFACHPTGDATSGFNHNNTAFPLTGAHTVTACADCHTSGYAGTTLVCGDCHVSSYNQTSNPNHQLAGIPNTCADCHSTEPGWRPAAFPGHNEVYPLNGAHATISNDCASCHNGNYNGTPNTCAGCHLEGYNQTTNPPHASAQFPTECQTCHTESAWVPSTFNHDGQYFPVYSGKHNGEWSLCSDCHTNPSDYSQFSCIDCHEHNQADMNSEHQGIGGYSYNSPSCFACHPTGDASAGFDHNTTIFPLTGAHISTTCESCHSNGYSGTTTLCSDCHTNAFTQTANPNHVAIGIPNTCADCHTTVPGWQPATFPIHNQYYPLNGAHAAIAVNCSDCHSGNYTSTPNTCAGCHLEGYNQTTNPPHASAQFPTECQTCHTESAWVPSTFNHDGQYFPVYSGKHNGEWSLCSDCHTNPSDYSQFSCIDCHEHNQADMNSEHQGIGGYSYNSPSCFACHPTGDASAGFDHNTTIFPLTGAHISTTCESCHSNGFSGTTTLCSDCHTNAFTQTVNPNHVAIGIPNTCADCHTTVPGWQPATFPIHNQYYPLNGAHSLIAGNCSDCHNGNYTSTPNTCADCHMDTYNQTNDPPHLTAQFPVTCQDCHNENGWTPSTFNHDNQYFPIYSGEHNGEWNTCADCHTNPSNYAMFSCIDCHEHNQAEMDDEHDEVSGYQYNSNACFNCHPDGDSKSMIRKQEFRQN